MLAHSANNREDEMKFILSVLVLVTVTLSGCTSTSTSTGKVSPLVYCDRGTDLNPTLFTNCTQHIAEGP
jgi:hypothetical protein